MNKICPWCRSELELSGSVDISAPRIQQLICPVCKYILWQAAGFPLPRVWKIIGINQRYEPPSPIPAFLQTNVPESEQQPAYQFQMPDWIKSVTSGLGNIGIWIVVVLVLILLVKRK
jgi:hypothetical protein